MPAELEALTSSGAQLQRRLRRLLPSGYGRPSVCAGWSVFDLANHVVGGERRYLMLLRGAGAAAVEPLRGQDHIGDDAASAYVSHSQLLDEEFRQPGALQRSVHHRAGDRSGLVLLRMRVMERALHAWDLARTLGLDDRLDPALVEYMLANCVPLVPGLRGVGLYGPEIDSGPARPLYRLLGLTGRRPGSRPAAS